MGGTPLPLVGLLALGFWAVIVGVLGLVLVWALRQAAPSQHGARRGPVDILKERYARGELTREQYEQMRRDLEV